MIIRLIRKCAAEIPKERAALKDRRERAAIARAFNDRYTFCKQWKPSMDRLPGTGMFGITPAGGYAWMCPDCNQIQHPTECSALTGLQYPMCCNTPAGHRLDCGIRTTWRGPK